MSKDFSNIKRILFYLFLILYIFLLVKILFFKYISPLELFNSERIRNYNLIPFETINRYFGTNFNIWIAIMNVIGNIIIFVPLGIYLQIFKKNKNILYSVFLACAISLAVEIIQYIFAIGAFDIDDIILNTIGGFLGVLIYRILYFFLKDENKIKTAIIFLYSFAGLCVFIFIAYITFFTGLKIKIF